MSDENISDDFNSFLKYVHDKYINKLNCDHNTCLKVGAAPGADFTDIQHFIDHGNVVFELPENDNLKTLLDVVYAKDNVQDLDPSEVIGEIDRLLTTIKPGGLVCVEIPSESLSSPGFIELQHKENVEILECHDDSGDSIRFIGRRLWIDHIENSSNYNIYKPLLNPEFKQKVFKGYRRLCAISDVLLKYDIDYVAVAGTLLGLNRHGGIIPWDDDIDIGIISTEWDKLLSHRDELAKDWWIKENSPEQMHIGSIDCFRLELDGEYYHGRAKTCIHVDEYQQRRKQMFGYSQIIAPVVAEKTLIYRFGSRYYDQGDVNDNFHQNSTVSELNIPRFNLTTEDRSFIVKDQSHKKTR